MRAALFPMTGLVVRRDAMETRQAGGKSAWECRWA